MGNASAVSLAMVRDFNLPSKPASPADFQSRFRELLEALPAAVYVTDAAGRVTFFNHAAVRFSGRVPEIGSDQWCVTWRLHWPDGRPMPHAECPMARALKENRAIPGEQAIAERPDGTRVPFMAYPTPLHDASGVLVGAVNMLVDLTDRKRAEAALLELTDTLERRVEERTQELTDALAELRASERRFRYLVEGVADHAIFALDADGIVSDWNSGAERLTGYRRDEIVGRHFSCFYTPEDQRAGLPRGNLLRATRRGSVASEGWRLRNGGSRFWASTVINAIRDEAGALIGFAKITRDMTERRAVEEQLHQAQKMEAVGQLTNGIAHDFNNVLAAIIPNLELTQALIDRDPARKYLDNAMHAAEQGAELTNQLLRFSRRQTTDAEPVDVGQLIGEACTMLPRMVGPQIAIEQALDDDLCQAVTTPSSLQLAILNLAINARDAMPAGGHLTIGARNLVRGTPRLPSDLPPGDYVVISVIDTGSGMSEQVRSHAFDPFFTTKRPGKGTGLGLSMVYAFAKQSGGTVTIDSEIGRGTAVHIYLPRVRPRFGRRAEPAAPHDSGAGPPSRVLVVDDNSDVLAAMSMIIREFGHEVTEAASGQAALDLLERQRQFDLLMIDLAMPVMDGAELAEEARRCLPGVPILFVTGDAEAPAAAAIDAAQVLKKPYRQTELADKLRDLLGRGMPGQARPRSIEESLIGN
jgi:PAS domain S-box-containing protein